MKRAHIGMKKAARLFVAEADHPNFVVDKEATESPSQIAKIAEAKKEISLICCDSPKPGLVIPVMALLSESASGKIHVESKGVELFYPRGCDSVYYFFSFSIISSTSS